MKNYIIGIEIDFDRLKIYISTLFARNVLFIFLLLAIKMEEKNVI